MKIKKNSAICRYAEFSAAKDWTVETGEDLLWGTIRTTILLGGLGFCVLAGLYLLGTQVAGWFGGSLEEAGLAAAPLGVVIGALGVSAPFFLLAVLSWGFEIISKKIEIEDDFASGK